MIVSPLFVIPGTRPFVLIVTCFSVEDHVPVNLEHLNNVKRVELFNFTIEQIDILRSINATKLEDLLIATNQKHMGGSFWPELDSALVALQRRMGSNQLNFYLISDNDKSLLELEGCKGEGVIIDKSVAERSMRWMGSSLHGSGRRCKPPDYGVTK